jgi:hypothetical protein
MVRPRIGSRAAPVPPPTHAADLAKGHPGAQLRYYAASQKLSVQKALKKGMAEKAVEFKKAGVEIYGKE